MENNTDRGAAYDGAVLLRPESGEAPPPQSSRENYYADVLPEDCNTRNSSRKRDGGAAVKIGLTVFGVALAIAACVAVLTLL